jgi:hypothetical protein
MAAQVKCENCSVGECTWLHEICNVRGVKFKVGHIFYPTWMSDGKHQAVMYDCGVMFIDDGGASSCWGWDELEEVYV